MSIVYNIFYNLAKLFARCFYSLRIVHPERMIEDGPLILAVNHSSYFDPPLAGDDLTPQTVGEHAQRVFRRSVKGGHTGQNAVTDHG